MKLPRFPLLAVAGFVDAAALLEARAATSVPQYFQTTPELFAGPTSTGTPPFLAQDNPAPFPGVAYIPPTPLETQVPISGQPEGGNIFQLMGQLSHYFPNPTGFGVDEYSLPAGAKISQLHMLHRHGARYPTEGSGAQFLAGKIANNTGNFTASGQLSFLNDYVYGFGAEILVPVGKQELFDSGTQHYYNYGHLYPNDGSKIITRTTTQDRMIQSAEYFLSGFFGLQWPENATLEVIIEGIGFNNSLAGYDNCNNSGIAQYQAGNVALGEWYKIYLADATSRIQKLIHPHDFFNVTDVYNMQSLCAYETVAFGFSNFCDLFTYDEWRGYEYSVDINFAGNDAFQSPTGRAVGAGWVQELRARLMHKYIKKPTAQVNVTLDSMASTFPLDQSLYFDFSHDTNIMSILTALGLKQFAKFLPATHMIDHELIVSHLEPFAARLDIEIIDSPQHLAANPPFNQVGDGPATYVHFKLNQRTIPLGVSYAQCGNRADGWCELKTFLDATADSLALSQYDYACNGNYKAVKYGKITNGHPLDNVGEQACGGPSCEVLHVEMEL